MAISLIPGTGTTPVPINFATTSDDGSMLYIDGNAVVNNNNFQGATQATGLADLTPGLHTIDVEYYQGGGGATMDVQWDPTGGTNFVDIPNSAFSSIQAVNGVTMTGSRHVDPVPYQQLLRVNHDQCRHPDRERRTAPWDRPRPRASSSIPAAPWPLPAASTTPPRNR